MATQPTREQLEKWDRSCFWHPFTQMQTYQPLVIRSAQGCWLEDIEGRRYLDGGSSLWCNIHGHRHPRIDDAIRRQLGRAAHVTCLGASCETTILLARKLVELAPAGLEHVFFSSDGACAVEVALKIAFQYWRQKTDPQPQRQRFLALGSAYHGDTIGGVSLGGIDQFHALFAPLLFDTLHGPLPTCYRLPPRVSAENALEYYVDQYEDLLREHQSAIAAIVAEPLIQGAAGMVTHPPGFLAQLRRLADRYGTLLIADEVAVGMGRSGTLFACEQEAVVPDLLCLGKGLSGGYLPIAATLARCEIWDAFLSPHHAEKTLFHGHTFSGNALSAAAAQANLDVFEQDHTLQNLPSKIQRFRARLEQLASLDPVGDVRTVGLIGGVEIVQNRQTKVAFDSRLEIGRRICRRALQQGVWLRPIGDTIVVMPPLVISQSEIDFLFDGLQRAIQLEMAQPPAASSATRM